MRGASLVSRDLLRARLAAHTGSTTEAWWEFARQLCLVVDAIDGSPALLQDLANPNWPGEQKASLARRLTEGFGHRAQDLVAQAAASRWSYDEDLPEAIDDLALDAALSAIESAETLSEFEQELFAAERFLRSQRDIRAYLADATLPAQVKARVLHELFDGKLHHRTVNLIVRIIATGNRGRLPMTAILRVEREAAGRYGQLVGHVVTAHPLDGPRLDRLKHCLDAAYGRRVRLNCAVDPSVIGGLRVTVADDVVDATVRGRIEDLKHQGVVAAPT
ncbi:MAG: F0F1 ATP synthase subunit delta [Bifidobacteriaceae bacterium]|jgi:F-type H+-transporting ATPase subunit delta|nr:F0F1 ATP synthase subunit delta [Bifidobacteriaceae bacterium]